MNMKYKYVVFSPYFGKLPSYFNLWLNSCSYNTEFKFIVFTDDNSVFNVPSNVELIKIKFSEFVDKIQKKFDFKLALNNPYKLCDFKPTYGYVFPEYLDECEYWGHCDLDLIFGNLSKFLPSEKYDKIAYLGHFCLYKNDKIINEMFMNNVDSAISYREILSNSQHFGFDEIGNYGINNIFKTNNLKIYNYEVNVADIDCRKDNLTVIKYKNEKFMKEKLNKIFLFDCGRIISIFYRDRNSELEQREYAYIHLQKRKMSNNTDNFDKYFITYKSMENYEEINFNIYLQYLAKVYFLNTRWFKLKIRALKNRIKRSLTILKIKILNS